MEELQCKTVFTIPVFGGIPIAESVAVTWVIMAVLLILSLVLVRNLSVENPGKKQLLLEAGVGFLHNFFEDILGEEGKMYIPYLMTVVIYIGIANIFGVFGFVPPTKDLNCTIGLAITSIFLIEYAGFHKKGLKGFLKSFAEPSPVMLPISRILIGSIIGAGSAKLLRKPFRPFLWNPAYSIRKILVSARPIVQFKSFVGGTNPNTPKMFAIPM